MTDEDDKKKKDSSLSSVGDLFKQVDIFGDNRYVTKEFQDYGLRLAHQLNDYKHKSLYIKLAKTEKRFLLDSALRFTADYPSAQNKGKIFMWKLKELKKESKEEEKD